MKQRTPTLIMSKPTVSPSIITRYRHRMQVQDLQRRHNNLSSQDSISLAGWNGAMREAIVNLFILFPVAAGRFMIREAKQDDCGLNAGINTVSYSSKLFTEKTLIPKMIKYNRNLDQKKHQNNDATLTNTPIKCTV
jgi:hypothetical protein